MKINKGLLITLCSLVLIGIAGSFITFDVSRSQTINASMFDLSAQLSSLQNWKKWSGSQVYTADSLTSGNNHQPQLAILHGTTVAELTVVNPAMFQFKPEDGSAQTIELLPTEKENAVNVLWVKKINGFQWLAMALSGGDATVTELARLKKFAESSEGVYGFRIESRKVTDFIICTKKQIVAPGNLQPHMADLLSAIQRFLRAHKVPVTKDYYYVSSSALVGGKIELAAGIPVQAEIPGTSEVEFLKFPQGGNLLVGIYEGSPSGIRKIYAAMNKYVLDKRLSKVAQPMEKYTDAPNVLNKKSNIKMQLIYPVY